MDFDLPHNLYVSFFALTLGTFLYLLFSENKHIVPDYLMSYFRKFFKLN